MNNPLVANIKCLVALLLFPACLVAQEAGTNRPATIPRTVSDSGGLLIPEQAAYDVTHYDLSLRVDPVSQSIAGALIVHARIVSPIEWFVLDLYTNLEVVSIAAMDKHDDPDHAQPLRFERRAGKIWIALPSTKQPGDAVSLRVTYGGKPIVARNPPWSGGFTWSKTADGQPWIGVSCQEEGADIWWPCKDHPSDEPETMALHITVPQPLVCAANGRLQKVEKNKDGTQTFHWFVSQPINNYCVSINIAPYHTVEGKYKSVSGQMIPVTFWALPQDYDKARVLFPNFLKQIAFYEELLGPYPFRKDKIGVAEAPYLGMEHQTITAYGSNFKDNEYGFDWLLFHEFGHEWWGNLVTCPDWRDMWIHEGFETYMEALYAERLQGNAAYRKYIDRFRTRRSGPLPVAPRESKTTKEMNDAPVYFKGALVLHTLRYLIGDQALLTAFRRMTYPDPKMERIDDGRQCHFATTEDFRRIAEDVSGKKLDWFFELYVRQPKLPRLITETNGTDLVLHWQVPDGLAFPMPVEIQRGDDKQRVDMTSGSARIPLDPARKLSIDPDGWILREN